MRWRFTKFEGAAGFATKSVDICCEGRGPRAFGSQMRWYFTKFRSIKSDPLLSRFSLFFLFFLFFFSFFSFFSLFSRFSLFFLFLRSWPLAGHWLAIGWPLAGHWLAIR